MALPNLKAPLVLLFALLQSSGTVADDRIPLIDEINGHSIVSATGVSLGGNNRIFYQICNRSAQPSAFIWHGAGIGTDTFSKLDRDYCAIKNVYSLTPPVALGERIEFENGIADARETYVLPRNIFKQITSYAQSLFGYDLGNVVEVSAVEVRVSLQEDGSAWIQVSSEGNFDSVVMAFPEASLDYTQLSEVMVLKDGASMPDFNPMEGIIGETESNFLIQGIGPDMPVARIRTPEPGPQDAMFLLQSLEGLGNVLVAFGVSRGQFTLRNDVPIPSPG